MMTDANTTFRWVEPYTPPCRRHYRPRKPSFVPRSAPIVVVAAGQDSSLSLPTLQELYEAMCPPKDV